MSLLLDALKRAEQAKLAKAAEEKDSKGLAPSPEPEPVQQTQPESALASERTIAQKKFAPAILAPAPTAPLSPELPLQEGEPAHAGAGPGDEQAQREAAKNVFAAKQPLQQTSRKTMLYGIGLLLIAVTIGGVYLWLEMNKLNPAAPRSAPTPIQPITQAPRDTLPAASPGTGQITTSAPSASAAGGTPPPPLAGKAEVALPERAASIRPTAAQAARDAVIKSLNQPLPDNDPPVALKLSKVIEPPRVSAELASAYDALKSGNNARARTLYAGILQGDALNLDAHLGMATALARGGNAGEAAQAFRQALELDPRNGTALAGLLAVSDQSNPGALEAGLKSLLSRHHNSAALAFSLGNLYATQSRWTEAQQAYFDAFRIEPGNADYLYNLAVSLDHLKQPKLALDYYERAMATAGKAGAQFDHGQVSRRVNELKSVN